MAEVSNLAAEQPKIYAAIAGVIDDIGVVAKDRVNKQQGFKYRSVDDVYSVLNPALAKNKVFILPEITDETREIKTSKNGTQLICVVLTMKYTIYAEDGSYVETILKGEAMDTADKAINKAMAIAYKYLCFQLFCIPVEDMADPDAEAHEVAAKKGAAPAKSRPKKSDSDKPAGGKLSDMMPDPETDVAPPPETEADPNEVKISAAMVATIRKEEERTGVTDKQILERMHLKTDRIEDMTVSDFQQLMKIFKVTKDRKKEAAEDEYQ